MNPNWLQSKDLWAGLFYMIVGGVAFSVAQSYPMGTSARMGSGYFPIVLSSILFAIGLISVVRGIVTAGETVERIAVIPAAAITAAVVLFAVLLPRAGLAISLVLLIFMSAAVSRQFRFEPQALAGMLALVALCVLVFVKGLGVPMPILGIWFGE